MMSRIRSRPGGGVSVALILSYVFDWIIIILAAVIGGVFSIITPNKRPFSLVDPDVSFPYVTKEKISTATLVLCGLVAPVIIIFLVAIFLVPGPTVPKSTPKALIWRRKLWELHTGWLGLGLSLAAAFLITGGMKNLFGKPRVSHPPGKRGVSHDLDLLGHRNAAKICHSLISFPVATQTLQTSPIMPSEAFPTPRKGFCLSVPPFAKIPTNRS